MTVKLRRIMREFAIDEISAVTTPAQKGARMVIMKRADDDSGSSQLAKGAYVLTTCEDGHQHLVCLDDGTELRGGGQTDGCYCGDGTGYHLHPFTIDDMGNVLIGEALAHGHELSTASQNVEDLEAAGIIGDNIEEENEAGGEQGEGATEADKGCGGDVRKRAFSAKQRRASAASGAALSDGSYPIKNTSDLKNAIHAWGRAPEGKRAAVARHIASRAKTLGATDSLPTSGPLADALGRAKKSASENQENNDMTIKKFEIEEGKLAELLSLAGMNDAQKAHLAKLAGADRDSFVKADSAQRNAIMAKLAGADPVVYTTKAGVEIRKSDGGTALALAQSVDAIVEQNSSLTKALEATTAAALDSEVERIVKGLEHIGKPIEEKRIMVKGILGLPEAARKTALDALQAGAGAFGSLMKSAGIGHVPGVNGTAAEKLEKLAHDRLAKTGANGETYEMAYVNVLQTPEGAQLYGETLHN